MLISHASRIGQSRSAFIHIEPNTSSPYRYQFDLDRDINGKGDPVVGWLNFDSTSANTITFSYEFSAGASPNFVQQDSRIVLAGNATAGNANATACAAGATTTVTVGAEGGGLSPGAAAGIGVGVIIGVLTALLWRRVRRAESRAARAQEPGIETAKANRSSAG